MDQATLWAFADELANISSLSGMEKEAFVQKLLSRLKGVGGRDDALKATRQAAEKSRNRGLMDSLQMRSSRAKPGSPERAAIDAQIGELAPKVYPSLNIQPRGLKIVPGGRFSKAAGVILGPAYL